MREIIFRGKNPDNGKWYEGAYSPHNWDFFGMRSDIPQIIIVSEDKYLDGKWIEVIPETVGQYTGLTDKNGKKVFEGDILFSSYIADSPSIEVVKWIYNGWHTQEGDLTPDMIDDVGIMPYSEVIGNVHDNPRLLKGE